VIFQNNVSAILSTIDNYIGSFYYEWTFKIGVFLFTSPFRIYSSNLREDPNGKYIKTKIAQKKK
jgi:hypothetical protein